MKLLWLGLLWIAPPIVKKLLLRWLGRAKIGRHVELGWFSAVVARQIALADYSAIRPLTLVYLHGDFELGAYSEISSFNLIYGSSSLKIGAQSYIGPQSLINVEEPVCIGNGSALGPRTMVFTHGSFLPYTEGYWARRAGVTLGNKVWCAAGVFIQPGVEIGDETFVNSCAVVTQSIPAGSIVEGNPARVVAPMSRLRRKMNPARIDAVLQQMLRDFAEVGLRRELGIQQIEIGATRLRFQWRRQTYEITLIPSTGMSPLPASRDVHQIFLVNQPAWHPPPGATCFDLTTARTPFQADVIHTALRVFLQRYYGVRFQDTVELSQ